MFAAANVLIVFARRCRRHRIVAEIRSHGLDGYSWKGWSHGDYANVEEFCCDSDRCGNPAVGCGTSACCSRRRRIRIVGTRGCGNGFGPLRHITWCADRELGQCGGIRRFEAVVTACRERRLRGVRRQFCRRFDARITGFLGRSDRPPVIGSEEMTIVPTCPASVPSGQAVLFSALNCS